MVPLSDTSPLDSAFLDGELRQPAETLSEMNAVRTDTLASHPLNALGPTGGMRDQVRRTHSS
jgi:hypothetical protein